MRETLIEEFKNDPRSGKPITKKERVKREVVKGAKGKTEKRAKQEVKKEKVKKIAKQEVKKEKVAPESSRAKENNFFLWESTNLLTAI